MDIACLAKSTYYYHLNKVQCDIDECNVKDIITEICVKHKFRYGYRRVTMELRNQHNIIVNHKKVLRIMKEYNLLARRKRKTRYSSYKGKVGTVANNLIDRNFSADRPYEKVCTDVTEFRVGECKLYLSAAIDLYSRKIVGYSVGKSPTVNFVLSSIRCFIDNEHKMIIYNDQGFQYQNKLYQNLLLKNNCEISMSRKGNCLDNSPIENFFSILKNEMYHFNNFKNIEELTEEINKYIKYYNEERISLKIKGMTPSKYLESFQLIN